MDAVEGVMDCTKSVQLLEEPGLSMGLEVRVAKLEAGSGEQRQEEPSPQWELKLDITSVGQVLEKQKSGSRGSIRKRKTGE